MKRLNLFMLVTVICTLFNCSLAFAVFPTQAVICDQAKVEIATGEILPADTFRIVLKVAANSTTDATNSGTTYCSVGSYNTTGELATDATTGYTQGGIAKTDGAWTLSTHSVNFTMGAATWTAVSASAVFDAIEIYDDSCDGAGKCTNADQLVAIFPITEFTGPTAGTYTVTPPANMFVLTYNEFGILQVAEVTGIDVGGAGKIVLPPLSISGAVAM